MQLICAPQTRVPGKVSSALSASPGSLGVGSGGISRLRLQVSGGRKPVGFLQVPQNQISGSRGVFVTLGPSWARADAEGAPRSGVWTIALGGPGRGAPPLRVLGARAQRDGLPTRFPPSPGTLAGTHHARGPALRAGPRSGSARPAQAPVVAAVGPLCGALWEPRERALGP